MIDPARLRLALTPLSDADKAAQRGCLAGIRLRTVRAPILFMEAYLAGWREGRAARERHRTPHCVRCAVALEAVRVVCLACTAEIRKQVG